MNELLLVECAQWLYTNRDKAGWWTPYVLTEHNPDKTNPNVNLDVSYEVFAELIRRRLVTHQIVGANDSQIPAFVFLDKREEEWRELIGKKGFWELKGLPAIKWLFLKTWLVVLFMLGTLTTFYLNHFATQSVERETEVQEYNIRLNEEQLCRVLGLPQKPKTQ